MLKLPTDGAVRVRVTPELLALFDRHHLHTAQRNRKRWGLGDQLMVHPDARIEAYAHILFGMTFPMAMGAFSYTCGQIKPNLRIGRYCSIANNVDQLGGGHPTDWVTSSPFTHNPQPMGAFAEYLTDIGVTRFNLYDFDQGSAPIEIGNDVWIGEHARLKPGIKIGDGAIVATRAIVTHDVPPYAIVGGMPGRVIRYRFPEDVIERIRATSWWRYGPEVIQPLDPRDPVGFADRFDRAVADGATPLDLTAMTGREIIAAGEKVE